MVAGGKDEGKDEGQGQLGLGDGNGPAECSKATGSLQGMDTRRT